MSIRKEQAFIQEMLPEAKAKREAALKRLAEDGQQIESDTAGPVSKCPCCQSVEVECCNCASQFSLAPVAQQPQEPLALSEQDATAWSHRVEGARRMVQHGSVCREDIAIIAVDALLKKQEPRKPQGDSK